jgi:hypothetical protein
MLNIMTTDGVQALVDAIDAQMTRTEPDLAEVQELLTQLQALSPGIHDVVRSIFNMKEVLS